VILAYFNIPIYALSPPSSVIIQNHTLRMQPFNAQLVVNLLLEFYTTLIDLSYLSPSTLILPPHTISEQEVQRFIPTMDPVVLDLIKRLPYLKNVPLTGGQEIGPGIRSHNLLAHLWFAQNPMEMDGDAKGEAGDYIEPWSIVLTDGYQGTYMVLNTRTGEFKDGSVYLLCFCLSITILLRSMQLWAVVSGPFLAMGQFVHWLTFTNFYRYHYRSRLGE
jgi:hypothetical protein